MSKSDFAATIPMVHQELSWRRKLALWTRANPWRVAGILAAELIVVIVVVGGPLLRYREVKAIEDQVAQASMTLIDALHNPAILTGTPPEAAEQLDAAAETLNRIHDELQKDPALIARRQWRAAVAFTEYTGRLGSKLQQVAQSQREAAQVAAEYQAAVDALKLANIRLRPDAQQEVNRLAPLARTTTELAYQNCVLLGALTRQYGYAQTQALLDLSTIGGDVQAAVGSIKPDLENATQDAHVLRKTFNHAARLSN